MNDNFTENDWNLFKSKIPLWQESYMERLVNEYTALLNENINPSDKFWKLEKRINQDKNHRGVLIEMRRSLFIRNLVSLVQEGVIEVSDLNDFSDKLIKTVLGLLKI